MQAVNVFNRSIEMGAQFQPCLCLLRPMATITLLLMPVPPLHTHTLIDIQQCLGDML